LLAASLAAGSLSAAEPILAMDEAQARGDGSEGFVIRGVSSSYGVALNDAGDLNDDGINDLIMGAADADAAGRFDAGETYVVFGRTSGFPAEFDVGDLFPAVGGDGSEGFVLQGVDANDNSGWSVSGVGDINGDAIDDLIIGAYGADPNGRNGAGESYVVFGRTTGFPAVFRLQQLFPAAGGDGSEGFVLKGIEAEDRSGSSRLAGRVGDVNGDDIDDIIVGAKNADTNGLARAGEIYVVFGRSTGFPAMFELGSLLPAAGGDGREGFVLKGIDPSDGSGASIAGAGDVNGDGLDDLLIGTRWGDPNGLDAAGECYVIFGRTKAFPPSFELSRLFPAAGGDGSEGFVLKGVDYRDYSGFAINGAGDINGDDIDDIIVGAYHADAGGRDRSGETYVVFGRTTGFPPTFELRSLYPPAGGDGSEGFVLQGVAEDDLSGYSVNVAGDINGDDIDDLTIGAIFAGGKGAGYVVFGRNTDFEPVFQLSSLFPTGGGDGSTGFVIRGVDINRATGHLVRSVDINDDDIDDAVITEYFGNPYIIFGRTDGFPPVFELSDLLP